MNKAEVCRAIEAMLDECDVQTPEGWACCVSLTLLWERTFGNFARYQPSLAWWFDQHERTSVILDLPIQVVAS